MALSPGARATCVLVGIVLLLGLSPPTVAQQITYEYDALGRLILMTAPEGVAQWEYDAVGNILRIISRRHADVPGAVAILAMSPTTGNAGTFVTLYGRGFGPTPGENQVAFNGAAAVVTAASETRLTVTVPPGATTGPVTLTAPLGSAAAPDPFTVLNAFAVVPDQADVVTGGVVDFQATLAGTPTADVTWRVNGVAGGNATLGTITATGTYAAPATPPPVQPVPVEAVFTTDPTRVAMAAVRVTGHVSGIATAPHVAVGFRPQPTPLAAAPVSVGLPPPAGPAVAVPVSVGPVPLSAPVASSPVAVTRGPVIGGVLPASGTAGTTTLTVALTGTNLQGATLVRLLSNGSIDSNLTAANVTPAADGTSASFTLTIAGSATPGSRVVQVVTPQGTSTVFDQGANTFAVMP